MCRPIGHPERGGVALQRDALLAVTDQQHVGVGHAAGELGQRGHQQVEALDRHEPAHPGDHERVRSQPQAGARRPREPARRRAARRSARRWEPPRTARPADAAREMLLDLAGRRASTMRVRPPRGHALQHRRTAVRSCAAPVAVEDVAVRLVDDHRHAGQPRGQPADESGLRGVRVHDAGRARGGSAATSWPTRGQVAQRMHLAAERRHLDDATTRAAARRRPPEAPTPARGRRVRVEPARQIRDRQRRCSPTSRPWSAV